MEFREAFSDGQMEVADYFDGFTQLGTIVLGTTTVEDGREVSAELAHVALALDVVQRLVERLVDEAGDGDEVEEGVPHLLELHANR